MLVWLPTTSVEVSEQTVVYTVVCSVIVDCGGGTADVTAATVVLEGYTERPHCGCPSWNSVHIGAMLDDATAATEELDGQAEELDGQAETPHCGCPSTYSVQEGAAIEEATAATEELEGTTALAH